ncbi:MAG: S9 family peptidase [Chloroflexi bacterium]|nr:S9 family peptidase [Chloroflexota bacterium]
MASEKRPIEVEDLYKITNIEAPRVSPDGQWIAYVHRSLDKLQDSYTTNIWLAPTAGGDPIQVTRSGKDGSPIWSPDGEALGFISARDEKPQVYRLPMTAFGGEARALTSAPNGVSGFNWSPDGSMIAYTARMNADEREREDSGETPEPPNDKLDAKQKKERKEHDEKQRWDPRFMWRIPYRVGTSYLDDRYDQIYVLPIAENLPEEEAKPRRLTNLDAHYSVPEWTPDGASLLTTRTIDPTGDEPWRKSSLYRIGVEDGSEEQLTDDSHADFAPRPSPDGKWIIYSRVPDSSFYLVPRFSVRNAETGETRDLTMELDRSISDYVWAKDSSQVYIIVDSEGVGEVHTINPETGELNKHIPGKMIAEALDVCAEGGVAFVASTTANPSELFWQGPGADEPQQLTDANTKFLEDVIVQETHEIWFEGSDGTPIQGWYLYPVDYQEGQKYPLAFNVHGGPHVMWGPSSRSMWHEWQFHAASGYAVFACNPRGSDGYGSEFRDGIHAAWGKNDMPDLMAGIDKMLEMGFIDEQRMAITGGSYGGFQTAWTISHTDRFAAAVSQRGVYSLISFYGTSDVPSLISTEFDVEPWENPTLLWENSPIAYAHNIKTPLLLIHAENDFRVPIEQAEQLFALVRRSGGTVEMWRYPRDGHELSRSGEPRHRVSRLSKMIEWFDKYCKA